MMKKIKVLHIFVIFIFGLGCQNEPYEGDFPTENDACLLALQASVNAAQDFTTATDNKQSLLSNI